MTIAHPEAVFNNLIINFSLTQNSTQLHILAWSSFRYNFLIDGVWSTLRRDLLTLAAQQRLDTTILALMTQKSPYGESAASNISKL